MSSSSTESALAWPVLTREELGPKQQKRLDEIVGAGMWETMVLLASRTLERLTAHRVGIHPITVRPVRPGRSCGDLDTFGVYSGAGMHPVNWEGVWFNEVCGAQTCEIKLPPPVGEIVQVIADGAVVPPGDYELQNGYILVFTGNGPCPWRMDQDPSLPLTEPGTFGITYLNAFPVDDTGRLAVTLLALELGAAYGGATCKLPSNVTSIVRNGMAMNLVVRSFTGGNTGISEVDAYVALWNPQARSRASTVWSPDLQQHRTT